MILSSRALFACALCVCLCGAATTAAIDAVGLRELAKLLSENRQKSGVAAKAVENAAKATAALAGAVRADGVLRDLMSQPQEALNDLRGKGTIEQTLKDVDANTLSDFKKKAGALVKEAEKAVSLTRVASQLADKANETLGMYGGSSQLAPLAGVVRGAASQFSINLGAQSAYTDGLLEKASRTVSLLDSPDTSVVTLAYYVRYTETLSDLAVTASSLAAEELAKVMGATEAQTEVEETKDNFTCPDGDHRTTSQRAASLALALFACASAVLAAG